MPTGPAMKRLITSNHMWLRNVAGPVTLLVVPCLIFIGIYFLYAVWTAAVSFTDLGLIGRKAIDPSFVGFKNYVRLFTRTGFLDSLWVTIQFTMISAVLGQSLFGLTLAAVMKSPQIRLKPVIEFAFLFGWLVPDIVAAFMWNAFANRDGFINSLFLGPLGFDSVNLLNRYAMTVIIVANIWKGTAWSYLLFSASLDSVSSEMIEAAYVDGAKRFQRFWYVILPMIKTQIVTNVLFVTIWTFSYFPLVWGLTGGGPGRETEVLSIFMYRQAFDVGRLGYGSAVAIAMLLTVGFFAIFYMRLLKEKK